jgi:hypothetical protein
LVLIVSEIDYEHVFAAAFAKPKPKPRVSGALVSTKRTVMAPDAPAPVTGALIAQRGQEPTARSLEAWAARVRGAPIVDVAHGMGISIESAKVLIREAHDAIAEDLKTNLDLNRQLDLDRVDGLLGTYYPAAKGGDPDCANVVIKCLQHRAKLNGLEPQPDPGRSKPENVLIWIQNQLPSINRIVDAMPLELPPGAPV